MGGRPLGIFLLVAVVLTSLAATCGNSASADILRERAIEIARSQVSFTPDTIEAVRTMSGSRRVWRVTLRGRLPGQPPGLSETAIVDVDATTGAIVSIART